jgi:hypothetical protein
MSPAPGTRTTELRLHPKLAALWPPEPGGAFSRESAFPIAGEDVLEQVFYYAPVGQAKANISLKTNFRGGYHTRDLLLDDESFAQRLATRLRQEIGHTIEAIGQVQLDF